jgi:hypothetical protein
MRLTVQEPLIYLQIGDMEILMHDIALVVSQGETVVWEGRYHQVIEVKHDFVKADDNTLDHYVYIICK